MQSHFSVWKTALEDGVDSVLVFEDDAVFADDFTPRCRQFLDSVPDDWGQIYLGGQHLNFDRTPPERVNEHVAMGRCVNRTHAYAIRRPCIETALRRLDCEWPTISPVSQYNFDHQLARCHGTEWQAYCPMKWLVGQASGKSDVNQDGRYFSTMWWKEFPVVEPTQC
jgi:GR25 family glycosyltransferase involved in LPS biosynthesis